MPDKDNTIGDIIESEKDLLLEAEEKYGDYFKNAAGFNELLNSFLKSANPDAWIFILFLSQIKKHHLLALFSIIRRHHIQAMLNMRQVLEAGVNAAYAIEYPDQDKFVVKRDDGFIDAPQKLQSKRYTWLKDNHKEKSDFIKNMKDSINNSCAHSNLIYAFSNFDMDLIEKKVFGTPFFDNENDFMTKTDLWMIGNIVLGLLDLFYGVNKTGKTLVFADDFVPRLKELEAQNHALKAELEKHPRRTKVE